MIADLVADPENRRTHNARNLDMVAASLRHVGAARSIVIDEGDVVLAGNGVTAAAAQAGITRVRVIEADGDELIAVRRRGLTAEQKRALAIYDNRTAELAEWNAAQLGTDLAAGLDLEPWFSPEELAALGVGSAEAPAGAGAATLAERFGVPPFSVLDARQGYWQDRKRAWLSLGIESELGRGAGIWTDDTHGNTPADRQAKYKTAAPGGSPRPAAKTKHGKTQRGDGRGRTLARPAR